MVTIFQASCFAEEEEENVWFEPREQMEDSNIQNLNEETTYSAEYLNGEFSL